MAEAPITARDKLREALREIAMRQKVYPARVAQGKMSQRDASRQIAVMEAIAADYRAQAEAEDAAGRLL